MPTAFCPHQPECTGCPLALLPYSEQLQFKTERISQEFHCLPLLQHLELQPILAARSTEGYRLRAKLVHQAGQLGLYAANHQVVDTPQCRIVHPRLQTSLNGLRVLLPLPCELLAVDARLADSGVLLTLVVPISTSLDAVQAAAELILRSLPDVKGVAYSERAAQSAQVLGGVPVPVAGTTDLRHTFMPGRPHHLAVFGGFVQAHAEQTAALHDLIVEDLERRFSTVTGLRVVELYAGAGALALQLAALGARVTAIDAYAPSVALLERTARAQGLTLTTVAGNAEESLSVLRDADVIVVDPPRRGLSVEVRQAIAGAAPRLVIYVSCDPRTLARDLSHLAWLGYQTTTALPIDMIPNSDAVETLAVLSPSPRPPLEVLYRDDALVAVNKPPHLPTTPHAEYSDSLLALVQNIAGCERAAPVHRLDVGTSGVCLFATHPRHAEQLGKELAAGQKTYLALAQGITHKRGTLRKALLEGRIPRAAETKYVRNDVVGTHSLINAFPVQGRKHQIRRHLAGVGHPLLGDNKYAKRHSARHVFERHGLDRPFLHCAEIELARQGTPLRLSAPLAPDLKRVLDSLTHTRPRDSSTGDVRPDDS